MEPLWILIPVAFAQEVVQIHHQRPDPDLPKPEEPFIEAPKSKNSAHLVLVFLGKLLVFSVITGLILFQLFLKTQQTPQEENMPKEKEKAGFLSQGKPEPAQAAQSDLRRKIQESNLVPKKTRGRGILKMEVSPQKEAASPRRQGMWLGDFQRKVQRSESIIKRNPATGQIFHSAEVEKEELPDVNIIEDSILVKLGRWVAPGFILTSLSYLFRSLLHFFSFAWAVTLVKNHIERWESKLKADMTWTGFFKFYAFKAFKAVLKGAVFILAAPFRAGYFACSWCIRRKRAGASAATEGKEEDGMKPKVEKKQLITDPSMIEKMYEQKTSERLREATAAREQEQDVKERTSPLFIQEEEPEGLNQIEQENEQFLLRMQTIQNTERNKVAGQISDEDLLHLEYMQEQAVRGPPKQIKFISEPTKIIYINQDDEAPQYQEEGIPMNHSEKILKTIDELQDIRAYLTMNREVKDGEAAKSKGHHYYEDYLKQQNYYPKLNFVFSRSDKDEYKPGAPAIDKHEKSEKADRLDEAQPAIQTASKKKKQTTRSKQEGKHPEGIRSSRKQTTRKATPMKTNSKPSATAANFGGYKFGVQEAAEDKAADPATSSGGIALVRRASKMGEQHLKKSISTRAASIDPRSQIKPPPIMTANTHAIEEIVSNATSKRKTPSSRLSSIKQIASFQELPMESLKVPKVKKVKKARREAPS